MLRRMGTLHELRETNASHDADERGAAVAFGFILFVLWVFSVARVVVAAEAREVFGAEASLAFLCMLALPIAAVRAWVKRSRPAPRTLSPRPSASVVVFRRRLYTGDRLDRP
jgi:hypothetical protein